MNTGGGTCALLDMNVHALNNSNGGGDVGGPPSAPISVQQLQSPTTHLLQIGGMTTGVAKPAAGVVDEKKTTRLERAVRFAPPCADDGDHDHEDACYAARDRACARYERILEDAAPFVPAGEGEGGATDLEDAPSIDALGPGQHHPPVIKKRGRSSRGGGVRATILGPGSSSLIDMSDPDERSLIWYSSLEIGRFKSDARSIASWIKKSEKQRSKDRSSCGGDDDSRTLLRRYRERFDRRGGGTAEGGEVGAAGAEAGQVDIGEGLVQLGLALPPELARLSDPLIDASEHRGLEFRVSFERQRNKFIALRSVSTFLERLRKEADKRGVELSEYPDGKIAYVSNKVTRWARNLARKEGLEDFRAAYPHIVGRDEVNRQAALSGIPSGVDESQHAFPLKWKKRKSPSATGEDSISDDLSSRMSSDMSLSNSSQSDIISLSSMKSNMSIQSSYIKVKPFFEAVAEEQEQQHQDLRQIMQHQQQDQCQGQVQQEDPKRRRRRGHSFTKGVTKNVIAAKALLGKKSKSTQS